MERELSGRAFAWNVQVLAVEDPTAGSWGGGGGSVVRVIDGCISLRTLVWIPSISVKIWV